MLIVGLTGGIASGKSTVSRRLREVHGIPVVDADIVAREVVEPGQPALAAIVEKFGSTVPDLLLDDGHLNRAALGRAIFGNEENRKIVNAIVHPAVLKAMAWQIVKLWLTRTPMVVADVPLLFESKLDRFCGANLVVLCDGETQYRRLRRRDPQLSDEDARNRIASQMPLEEKRRLGEASGIVLNNNGTLEELNVAVDEAVSKLQPSTWRTWSNLFPLVGIASAAWTYFH